MLEYKASRITSGNLLFPDKLIIDSDNVTYNKGHLTGYQSTIISRRNISSVYIGTGIFFGDIIIETYGGKQVRASGFNKSDAKSIIAFLSLNEQQKNSNISQHVYVNNNTKQQNDSNEIFEQTIKQEINNKMNPEKEIILLAMSKKNKSLTLKEILLETNIDLDEAENLLNNMVKKDLAYIENDVSGKILYRFEDKVDSAETTREKIENEILLLAEKTPILTFDEIKSNPIINKIAMARNPIDSSYYQKRAIENLVNKKNAYQKIDSSGKFIYRFDKDFDFSVDVDGKKFDALMQIEKISKFGTQYCLQGTIKNGLIKRKDEVLIFGNGFQQKDIVSEITVVLSGENDKAKKDDFAWLYLKNIDKYILKLNIGYYLIKL